VGPIVGAGAVAHPVVVVVVLRRRVGWGVRPGVAPHCRNWLRTQPPTIRVSEVRGPFGPRHRWSLWIVGRWPSFPSVSRGEPPCGSRRSPACPRGLDPPPEGRMPQPVGAREGVPAGSLRADRYLKGYNEGNWMAVRVPPVRRGCRGDRALRGPFHVNDVPSAPPGARGRPSLPIYGWCGRDRPPRN
jgi:hypothetical protein